MALSVVPPVAPDPTVTTLNRLSLIDKLLKIKGRLPLLNREITCGGLMRLITALLKTTAEVSELNTGAGAAVPSPRRLNTKGPALLLNCGLSVTMPSAVGAKVKP